MKIRIQKHLLIGVFSALLVLFFGAVVFSQVIRTPSEESGFQEYTSYEEMLQYLQDIQATSTEMLLSTFGKTIEGREQPYAIFSRPLVTRPQEATATGKPIVVLAANVHGGERTVRESLLMITRELATKGSDMNWLLDELIVIVVPSINPDGFVRATRGNSLGIDLNRDYMKLEQPAISNYVQNILLTWQPHIILDGHNGGAYPYNICYQGPANAASDQRITRLCDQEIFPFINSAMEKNGYKSWYYSGGDSLRWRGAPTDPRINTNYGGFINSFSILFESPRQDRDDGAKSGLVATRALLHYVAQNSEKVMMTVERARRETIEMGQNATGEIPVQITVGPKDYKVSYEIEIRRGGTIDPETGRRTGGTRELVQIIGADLMIEPVVTKSRPRPYAYLLEPRAYEAVEMLKRHKITIEVLQKDTEIDFEAYNMTGIEYRSEYDHPASVTVTFADETVKQTRTFPKGTYIIRTGQVMGRVAAHMLEPETNDNVVKWNAMDAMLPRMPRQSGERAGRTITAGVPVEQAQPQEPQPVIFPIFKIMTPVALPTKILKY
ncbi:hypothetical protein AMJ80_05985 [bacterium SM23_31]|nr:MAG: hypothetical protein AMJ80_05985 [bacterium SM23_31]